MLTTANCDRALFRLCHHIARNHLVCKFQVALPFSSAFFRHCVKTWELHLRPKFIGSICNYGVKYKDEVLFASQKCKSIEKN